MKLFPIGILLLGALIFLLMDARALWTGRVDLVSGDSLIHLVFARNFVEGRILEFNLNEESRALTSLFCNMVLVIAGKGTGLAHHLDGFLLLFRVVAVGFLVLACWLGARLAISLGAPRWLAWGGLLLAAVHPVTFYWTVANPMETSLSLVLVMGLQAVLLRMFGSQGRVGSLSGSGNIRPSCLSELHEDGHGAHARAVVCGAGLAGLSLLLFLNRPEHLIFGIVAGAILLFVVPRMEGKWAVCGWLLGLTVLGLLFYGLVCWAIGISPVPSANSARRLMLLQAATPMPFTGWMWSLDPWLLAASLFPLPLGAGILAICGSRGERAVAVHGLVCLGVGILFFSLYFYTTWQGRYLLPFLFLLAPAGFAGWHRVLPGSMRWQVLFAVVIVGFFFSVSLVTLRPLAAFAAGMRAFGAAHTEFFEPRAGDRTLLCLEVQGAYFHPQLRFISSEGLISPEALDARERGLTVAGFIKEIDPDLISVISCPLEDPDGIQQAILDAVDGGRNLTLGSESWHYLGWMRGTGPVWSRKEAE